MKVDKSYKFLYYISNRKFAGEVHNGKDIFLDRPGDKRQCGGISASQYLREGVSVLSESSMDKWRRSSCG